MSMSDDFAEIIRQWIQELESAKTKLSESLAKLDAAQTQATDLAANVGGKKDGRTLVVNSNSLTIAASQTNTAIENLLQALPALNGWSDEKEL